MEYYLSVPKNIPNFCRLLLLLILPLITDYQSAIMPIMKKLQKMNCSSRKKFKNEIFLKQKKIHEYVLLFYILKSKTLKKKISWINHMNLFSVYTLFENYSKCRILIFGILAFSTNFCPIKTDLSGNTVRPQASDFQKLAKMDHFWPF